jgi:hypothetical protein
MNYSANKLVSYSLNLTVLLIILLGTRTFAQIKLAQKNIVNKDAATAIEIRDSIIHPSIPSTGNQSKYWYKFIPQKDTILIFDILPIDPSHHYDFAVYQYDKKNSVNLKTRKLKGVRSCYSQDRRKQHGPRGLSLSAKKDTLETTGGYLQGYVRPFPIKAFDTCYIAVNWSYDNSWEKGFKLYLYNLWPQKPKILMSKPIIKPKEIVLENVLFETNKSILLKESYVSLNILVNQLASQKNDDY